MEDNTIQFNHNQLNGRTYAVDVNFNKEDLLECVHGFDNKVAIRVGISYLNPKDKHYNRKIGRETSIKKFEVEEFKLSSIYNDGNKSFLHLKSETLSLTFRVFKYSDKPHLIHVQDYIY